MKTVSQNKSKTVSQIQLELVIRIKLGTVASAGLLMPMTELAVDTRQILTRQRSDCGDCDVGGVPGP